MAEQQPIGILEKVPPKKSQVQLEFAMRSFELGPISIGNDQSKTGKLLDGDLNAHAWNRTLAKRIKTYKPPLVTLDGQVSSISQFGTKALDVDFTNKALAWFDLPARPLELNGTDTMYVTRSNSLYTAIASVLPQNMPTSEQLEIFQMVTKLDEEAAKKAILGSVIESGAELVLASLILATAVKMKTQSSELQPSTPKKFDRRGFLKISGKAIGLGGISCVALRYGAPFFSASAGQEWESNFWESIAPYVRNRFSQSDWVNGRGAIFIANTLDSLELARVNPDLRGKTSAAILGFEHAYTADDYLHNDRERDEAIYNFANMLLGTAGDIAEKYGINPQTLMQNLLTYITNMEVYTITDPGRDSTPDLAAFLKENVYYGFPKSRRVENAIAPLRDKIQEGTI